MQREGSGSRVIRNPSKVSSTNEDLMASLVDSFPSVCLPSCVFGLSQQESTDSHSCPTSKEMTEETHTQHAFVKMFYNWRRTRFIRNLYTKGLLYVPECELRSLMKNPNGSCLQFLQTPALLSSIVGFRVGKNEF